ncbi:hypothetical protein Mmc1_3200 [Magnetococcus marinus MC-1]|uniref:DUF1980 domain-containing protein n=1 Tax=Magnetococcus marinus (strain ATCC BAA-1437 / JCM 17883 / MC-1) TaxID=156889 RepID=A0LCJ7_MAGMM|nr:TIGR03943 family protein [Magnetococcus marinus]ABK45690.1 hypothetical protein Mmc1_3200 [Magnetococcus marinus MC-1]
MRRVVMAWLNWAPVFQMVGWLMFMGWISFGGYDAAYLADLQSSLLRWGWWLLLLMVITQIVQTLRGGGQAATCQAHDHEHVHDHEAPPQPLKLMAVTAVHFIPWLLFWITGVTSLTMQQDQSLRLSSIRLQQAGEPTAPPFDAAALQSGQRVEVNLIDIYSHDALKSGAKVRVVGRLMRLTPQQVQSYKPGHTTEMALLYRHAIACCAADASPIGLLLSDPGQLLSKVATDAWLVVEGTTSNEIEGEKILGLAVEAVQTIAAPRQPYLFWLSNL